MSYIYRLAFLIILFYFNAASFCNAQECRCSLEGDNSPAGIMNAHSHEAGRFMASYSYMLMNMKGLQSGANSISHDNVYNNYIMSPQAMAMNMHMLMLMYSPTDKLGIMLMGSYGTSAMDMEMIQVAGMHMPGMNANSNASSMKENSQGFNDVLLAADYAFIKSENHLFLGTAGISIPTGSFTKLNGNSIVDGQPLPYNMQPGSGTWNAAPKLTYVYHTGKFTFGNQAAGIFPLGVNSTGYANGNTFGYTTWAAWSVKSWVSLSGRVSGQVSDKIRGYNPSEFTILEPAADPQNYGGKQVSLLPGINFYPQNCFLSGSSIGIEYTIPLFQYVNGIQMPLRSAIVAKAQFIF